MISVVVFITCFYDTLHSACHKKVLSLSLCLKCLIKINLPKRASPRDLFFAPTTQLSKPAAKCVKLNVTLTATTQLDPPKQKSALDCDTHSTGMLLSLKRDPEVSIRVSRNLT